MERQTNMERMAGVDIRTVSREALVDVNGTTFDNTIPHRQRAAHVLEITGNPYCFRVGELCVKLEFLEDAPPLQDAFSRFLRRKKSGL